MRSDWLGWTAFYFLDFRPYLPLVLRFLFAYNLEATSTCVWVRGEILIMPDFSNEILVIHMRFHGYHAIRSRVFLRGKG